MLLVLLLLCHEKKIETVDILVMNLCMLCQKPMT